ncbi:hypothetical protein SAMN04487887_102456 [Enterococcus casseliflavus]|uniref:hypothetical protein n=1 Tax=Enterococcus casseliflavus TaxID=37734 RepID=UPI0008EC57EF|nr:hypothetical protein [Enterococcus casseliflavus]SFD62375.1 hypothetical protein SAMN04487887_102456 [Enterococcus casseliflavus]
MFNKEEKEFRCNHCKKVIGTGEVVWTKWPFPPKASAYQLKPRKELALINAPILCLNCSEKLLLEHNE